MRAKGGLLPDKNMERIISIISVEIYVTLLKKKKERRPPSLGNIPVKLVKTGGRMLMERMLFLMNCCCQQIKIPTK